MTNRSGPFWDGVEGRQPVPRAAATLGFEFVDADVDNGTIELAFTATDAFTNPAGNVLGAFVAAMLYDTVGPALLATLAPDQFQSTLDLNVQFLRAPSARAGSAPTVTSCTGRAISRSSRRHFTTPRGPSLPRPPLPPE